MHGYRPEITLLIIQSKECRYKIGQNQLAPHGLDLFFGQLKRFEALNLHAERPLSGLKIIDVANFHNA